MDDVSFTAQIVYLWLNRRVPIKVKCQPHWPAAALSDPN